MKIKVKKLHKDAVIPKYHSAGAAGFDLTCIEQITVQAGETVLVRTGLAFEIPEGYEMEVRPRSGISLNTKLRLSNSPGTVDCDYRGEVKFIVDLLMTKFPQSYTITKGMRLGQGLIKRVEQVEIEEVSELSDTERGSSGLGSTGIK